jgi:hypothetical protein
VTLVIEGATPEQAELLLEIVAGLGETRIEALRVEPWDPIDWDEMASLGIERGDPRYASPIGVAVVASWPDPAGFRSEWEAVLLGNAFRDRSAERGLPPVLWVAGPDGGHALSSPSARSTPSEEERKGLEESFQVAAAVTGVLLDRLEILEPLGLAPAATIAVAEPHAFLRHGLRAFLRLSGHVDDRWDGSLVEVVDGEEDPAWRTAYSRGWGMGSVREDLACCDPFDRDHTLLAPPRPACTVTARTFDDMLEAFRRTIEPATGGSLEEWLDLLATDVLGSTAERVAWLRSEHGLGLARAWAIAAALERASAS